MNIEQRIDRLERLFERIYHEQELLGIYIPKLTKILNQYWDANRRHLKNTGDDIHILRDFLKVLDDTLQGYMKFHKNEHFDAKKRGDTYTII